MTNSAAGPSIEFPGRFSSREIEEAYLLDARERIGWRLRVYAAISLFATAVFALADQDLVDGNTLLYVLWALRTLNVGLGAYVLHKTFTNVGAYTYERLALLLLCMSCALSITAVLSRPIGYTGHVGVQAVIAFVFYILLPARVHFQIVPAILISLASVYHVSLNEAADAWPILRNAILIHLAVNISGIVMSIQANYAGRREFVLALHQRELLTELETAMAEIKTLRGIVPMCAHCKKMRDDKGTWTTLESYLAANTHGQVSHGVCPECAKHHYGIELEKA